MRTNRLVLGVLSAGAAVAGGYAFADKTLRAWMRRWGATDDEVEAVLPGDDLTPDAQAISTRAITVHAPPERVWPWLCQIDQQRGGFYSYRWLEDLIGCEMPRVERLDPRWSSRTPGDFVWMAPSNRYGGNAFLVVNRADADRALVLVSPDEALDATPGSGSWAMVLRPVDAHTTRLVVRSRYARPNLPFEVAHFVMEQKMMRTIARLAEATPVPAAERLIRVV